MLKYFVLLMGALLVLAASDEAQARGLRRSRGSCPNGQCYAPVAAVPQVAATDVEADTAVAEAPVTESVAAPAATVATNVATYPALARSNFRFARGARFYRRR